MLKRDLIAKALAHHAQGQLADAEMLYRQVLQLHPERLPGNRRFGDSGFSAGPVREAAGLFTRGLAVRPGSARTHANLGEALRSLGQSDRAIDHLRRAAALDPTLAQVPNSLGLIAFEQGRRDEAEAAYREAIRLDPSSAAARINLANVHHARHRETEAAAELRLALKLEPEQSSSHLSHSGKSSATSATPICWKKPRPCAAARSRSLPSFPPRSSAWAMSCGPDSGIPMRSRATNRLPSLDPRRGLPYHYMGEHFQKLGSHDEAAACYSLARSLEPNEAQVSRRLRQPGARPRPA